MRKGNMFFLLFILMVSFGISACSNEESLDSYPFYVQEGMVSTEFYESAEEFTSSWEDYMEGLDYINESTESVEEKNKKKLSLNKEYKITFERMNFPTMSSDVSEVQDFERAVEQGHRNALDQTKLEIQELEGPTLTETELEEIRSFTNAKMFYIEMKKESFDTYK